MEYMFVFYNRKNGKSRGKFRIVTYADERKRMETNGKAVLRTCEILTWGKERGTIKARTKVSDNI